MRVIATAVVAAMVAVLAAVAFVAWQSEGDDQFASCRATQIAGEAGIGGPFTLVDHTGETVTDADVFTEPSLVYFGYTFCPDVCPLDVSRNAAAVDVLAESGHRVKPVFISIDPERDTPEVLAEYMEIMHPDMVGLTGTLEQVDAASKAYRTYYKRHDAEEGDDFYLVDHSTFSYLVLPSTGFAEFFRRDIAPEEMAERVACFLEHA